MTKISYGAMAVAAALGLGAAAPASADGIKIGVLGDQSNVASDAGGLGAIAAAKMAIADAGGKVAGMPIEIVSADFLTKPDNAVQIAKRWYESEGVDAITDLPYSGAGLAVQNVAGTDKKIALIAGAATSDITGKGCNLYATQWSDDTYSLAAATGQAAVAAGGKKWFFLTADYALGDSIQRDATGVIKAAGGEVIGSVRHPLDTRDFSSFLLQAQGSGANVIGLASVGANTIAEVKQAAEFGIPQGGQKLAGFLVFITDIHGIGLQAAQHLYNAEGFYWDQNDQARAFGKRFMAEIGRMPSKEQAATYTAVAHYLKAVAAAGTKDPTIVAHKMQELPVEYFGRKGSIRADGRVLYDMSLYEVKTPAESKYPWDYYKLVKDIPAEKAFRPIADGGCPIPK
ncbi:MAG: putative branched-chain amino transporter, periplasmic binding protein [Rhodospirillales bacterium]|nr:putative branched-chain amino transporter, periplasmic binding protein [Rhodospirillales bacterium]